jgi:hypothetical protein
MDVNGTWVNQNGSVVELHADGQGQLSGYYVSRKGRAVSGRRYPLVGQVSGEVLAFQVSWQDDQTNLHSITSFTGRLGRDADGELIHTVWVLARQWENEERTRPTGTWNAFLVNSDVFRRSEEHPR